MRRALPELRQVSVARRFRTAQRICARRGRANTQHRRRFGSLCTQRRRRCVLGSSYARECIGVPPRGSRHGPSRRHEQGAPTTTHRGGREVGGLMDRGGTAVARNSQNANYPNSPSTPSWAMAPARCASSACSHVKAFGKQRAEHECPRAFVRATRLRRRCVLQSWTSWAPRKRSEAPYERDPKPPIYGLQG